MLAESFNGYKVVYQGGHVKFTGEFEPVPINQTGGFAVDCQTWGELYIPLSLEKKKVTLSSGMAVLGQERVDGWYGAGTAYNVCSYCSAEMCAVGNLRMFVALASHKEVCWLL